MSSPEEKMDQLAQSLRKAEERRNLFIPPALDCAILKEAREHLTGEPKGRPFGFWNWFTLGTAVAAIALILLLLPRMKMPAIAREDINRDGHVDILDAMALAKAVGGNDLNLDQNADGKVDDADVTAVALAAVRVDRKS